jgi:hypothetical protein
MTVLAIGLVATITPLMSMTLASVPTEHSGMASAINNAVSRPAAPMSIGSMGLISVGRSSATGFAHVLEVSAALLVLGALCAALLITILLPGASLRPATSRRCAATGPVCNPPWPAALGRDRTIPSAVIVRAIDATRDSRRPPAQPYPFTLWFTAAHCSPG